MNHSWTFERVGPMGGSPGEAFTTPAQGTGIHPTDLLVRESIQNSVDALDIERANKVRVDFVQKSLTGDDKSRFVRVLGLEAAFAPRLSALPKDSDSRGHLMATVQDESASLNLLFVSDYNTTGLSGDPRSMNSHFFRLLKSIGDGSKARGEKESGGSFGFGKSAYSANSLIRTIVVYTVFDPNESGGDQAHARLMGCTYLYSHSVGDDEFTGRGWFGIPDPSNSEIVDPFTDEAAHEMAAALGFASRRSDQYGTSILIVDCPIRIEDIKLAVETWWWPRILDQQLDVQIVDNESKKHPPRIKSREELGPFINCYEIVVGRSSAAEGITHRDELRAREGVKPGVAAYQVLQTSTEQTDDTDSRFINSLALIRSLKMVVAYQHYDNMSVPVVGTFLADTEIDRILRSSEPLTHDKWDQDSARENGPKERQVVESLLRRLKKNFKDFSKKAAPPPPDIEAKASVLEGMLGKLLRPKPRLANSNDKHTQDPFRVVFETKPRAVEVNGALSLEGTIGFGLADHATSDSVNVALAVRCLPVEDSGVDAHNQIPLRIKCHQPELQTRERNGGGRIVTKVSKSGLLLFDFKSEPYHADWTVRVDIDVEELAK